MLGLPVTVVADVGHQLPKNYVSALLDSFLGMNSNSTESKT
jgi:hypothetical protein